MKYILSIFLGIVAMFNAVAESGIYSVHGSFIPGRGFFVPMYVDHQGPFRAEIDTGSTNFMVPGDAETCPTCNQPVGIHPTADPGTAFTVHYGSGRILTAHTYQTTVETAPLGTRYAVPPVIQTLGLITSVSGNGNASPILGMAQPARPNRLGLTTYLEALMQSNVIHDLGFMLVSCIPPKHGTELVLGGVDPRLLHTQPIIEPLMTRQIHFYVTPFGLAVQTTNQPIQLIGNFAPMDAYRGHALIDSGASNIYLPNRLFTPFITQLSNAAPTIPDAFWHGKKMFLTKQQIDALPNLLVVFPDHKALSLPPASYIYPIKHEYQLMIRSNGNHEHIVLGDPLFTQYAIYFDRTTEKMAFYPNKGLCL